METTDSNPLVSVIIPIYNAEAFLRETLDSVCAQTMRDIEIICVDDGSTDGTPAILAEYAARDPRFVLLRQQNKFAGAARNHGMSVARGKYISFLDSDDLFAPEMFERMVGAAEKWQADIVHCQACEYYPESGKRVPLIMVAQELLDYPEGPLCIRKELGEKNAFNFAPATWNKLYLASFLTKNKLKWPDTLYGEDVGFVRFAVYLSERSVILPDMFVRYRIRQGSLAHSKERDVAIYFRSYQTLHDRLLSVGASETIMQSFSNVLWWNILHWFIPTSTPATLEVFRKAYPEYDAAHFRLLEKPASYFYSPHVYESIHGFFHPSISFIIADAPLWCLERKLESLAGMPFYDYEILFPADYANPALIQLLEKQVARNPRLRIVPCTIGENAAETCRRAARGRIFMHLPGNQKLRAGAATSLRKLAIDPSMQDEISIIPFACKQARHEFFYRSRSDRRNWCLFGKPVFTIYYHPCGQKQFFILGKSLGAKRN